MKSIVKHFCLAILIVGQCSLVFSQVRINPLFSDHMVLQQNSKVSVWGEGNPGQRISLRISFQKKEIKTRADSAGNWMIKVNTPSFGGPFEMFVQGGKEKISVHDIYVGEVWLASGQSNMEFPLDSISRGYNGPNNFKEEIQQAKYPLIRQFLVTDSTARNEQKGELGQWYVCKPENARNYSAVAYFFARSLYRELNVPIGIINASRGASMIRAWMSARQLHAFEPDDEMLRHINADSLKISLSVNANYPSVLYNAMVAPIRNYTIKGVIWNQGEHDITDSHDYALRMKSMVEGWREDFRDADLPFLFVQIAPYNQQPPRIRTKYDLGFLVQQQSKALSLVRNSFMIRTGDIGNLSHIHYRNKQAVGDRLAVVALKDVYKKDMGLVNGPNVDTVLFAPSRVTVVYSSTGTGMISTGTTVEGFELSDDGKVFYPAHASIEGNKVIVTCPQVDQPISIRYCYKNTDVVNVFNSKGFPALPFQKDR